MATQLLVNVLSVGPLAPGASVALPHGLYSSDKPVVPTQVIADGPTTIGVDLIGEINVTFKNFGSEVEEAQFRVEYDHSIHAVGAPTVAWRGWAGTPSSLPPSGPAGGDLDQTYPDPRVVGFAGQPIDTSAPVNGDFWQFNGSQWDHTPVSPGSPVAVYGAFSSNVNQPISNSPVVVTFSSTDSANGVSLVAGSRLTVAASGVYSLTISPQLRHGGGGTEVINFWLRINGTDVADSASSFEMGNNNNRTLPFMEIVTPMTAGQYAEWVFMSDDAATNLTLEHFPATTGPTARPAIPSVIANVKRLGS